MFAVDVKTVSRWARAGKLSCVRTPGGHRRFDYDEVAGYLNRPGDSPQSGGAR
jgi:excisionase family DNA binding protein